MNARSRISRRDSLKLLSAASISGGVWTQVNRTNTAARESESVPYKSVAGVMTAYQKFWHADVIFGKILEGWGQNGGPGPRLKLASMYVDQFGSGDMARTMSEKYNVPIFDTIEEAVTVGGDRIPVDGVISVAEHGNYPFNEKQQRLYPRRRFFEEITDTFEKYGRVVPVFSDKHLGPVWSDAKWMYDRAQEMNVPFMAGTSISVTFRKPDVSVPMGCDIEAAVGVGYAGLDIYGSHTLDSFQAMVERRRGAETGVESVQYLKGESMWKAVDAGVVRKDVLDAALSVTPKSDGGDIRQTSGASLFLFEYKDGLLGTVLMLPSARGISTALKIKGQDKILATHYEERRKPYVPSFAYLLKGVERMVHTGRPSYPVERVLLSSGILDRVLTSRFENQKKLVTPELAIEYQPVAYPHAPHIDLMSDPTEELKG